MGPDANLWDTALYFILSASNRLSCTLHNYTLVLCVHVCVYVQVHVYSNAYIQWVNYDSTPKCMCVVYDTISRSNAHDSLMCVCANNICIPIQDLLLAMHGVCIRILR